MRTKVFRAHLDDVERLSYGKGAKRQRGTGSKFVCHRLNQEERSQYDRAKQVGFAIMKGSGYRKERKGSPLANLFRQRCDALGQICILIEKYADLDKVVIDFSTLRVRDDNGAVMLVESMIQTEYPDLYSNYVLSCTEIDDATKSNTSLKKTINWEVVRTKPIWQVNERLMTIQCDRDVAKHLASNILKVMEKFDYVETEEKIDEGRIVPSQVCHDSNEIDFDDI